ncbi:MAG: hypothetical protein EZS28_026339 [Streblomastix strix]|uniref:Importin subunit alpha n=1 Tax=Streblomastix strix TaxID=222440 RepID=A0A5J4V6R9_9EUKA|nr:MAG: hypothetical protein EZS28_026339 [Streblomastix strix]
MRFRLLEDDPEPDSSRKRIMQLNIHLRRQMRESRMRKRSPDDSDEEQPAAPSMKIDKESHKLPNIQATDKEIEIIVDQLKGIPTFTRPFYLQKAKDLLIKSKISDLQCINSGLIPPVLELLSPHGDDSVLKEAVLVVQNLVYGGKQVTSEVVKCGAVVKLADIIECEDKGIVTDALWALCNISEDEGDYISVILEAGVYKKLMKFVDNYKQEDAYLKKSVVWLLSNLIPRMDDIPDGEEAAKLIAFLNQMLISKEKWVLENTLACLMNIVNNEANVKIAVRSEGMFSRLFNLIQEDQVSLKLLIIQIYGHIFLGDAETMQIAINGRAVLAITLCIIKTRHEQRQKLNVDFQLEQQQKKQQSNQKGVQPAKKPSFNDIHLPVFQLDILKTSLWALSNVACGNSVQIQELIDKGAISAVSSIVLELQEQQLGRVEIQQQQQEKEKEKIGFIPNSESQDSNLAEIEQISTSRKILEREICIEAIITLSNATFEQGRQALFIARNGALKAIVGFLHIYKDVALLNSLKGKKTLFVNINVKQVKKAIIVGLRGLFNIFEADRMKDADYLQEHNNDQDQNHPLKLTPMNQIENKKKSHYLHYKKQDKQMQIDTVTTISSKSGDSKGKEEHQSYREEFASLNGVELLDEIKDSADAEIGKYASQILLKYFADDEIDEEGGAGELNGVFIE